VKARVKKTKRPAVRGVSEQSGGRGTIEGDRGKPGRIYLAYPIGKLKPYTQRAKNQKQKEKMIGARKMCGPSLSFYRWGEKRGGVRTSTYREPNVKSGARKGNWLKKK